MHQKTESRPKSSGFASMDRHKQREIARKGGMAAHQKGTAHEFTAEEARDAGRKGGQQVSSNRSHMIEIGRLGGRRSAERRRNRQTTDQPKSHEGEPKGAAMPTDAREDVSTPGVEERSGGGRKEAVETISSRTGTEG